MAFYILFIFAFSSFFDTSNANIHARTPKITMCVLEPTLARSRSLDEAYAQIEIITCQPHEVCSPITHDVNIGKFGLGMCKMVRPPVEMKMCIVKDANARMGNEKSAAVQIHLVECEANEVCVPFDTNKMSPVTVSIEIGVCEPLPTPTPPTPTPTTITTTITMAKNAESTFKPMKMIMCVLPDQYSSMPRSAYAQIDVVTCQPHERCSPLKMPLEGPSININIGKYGLGVCKMFKPPTKLEMCVVDRLKARMMPLNPPALTIDIVECEANEYCQPYPQGYPYEEIGGMPTSIELGRCKALLTSTEPPQTPPPPSTAMTTRSSLPEISTTFIPITRRPERPTIKPRMTMCVLSEENYKMQRNMGLNQVYGHIDIVTCQPHELCSDISTLEGATKFGINIGKYGLGVCKMIVPPVKMKMCVVPRAMDARMQNLNPAAIQIDIIECEANEFCEPYPYEERGKPMPTELGLCKALPTTLPPTTPPPTPTTSPAISAPSPDNVDLELCLIWPWQEPSRRGMILERINIVTCEPNEKCISAPPKVAEIYGLKFGICQLDKDTLPNSKSGEETTTDFYPDIY